MRMLGLMFLLLTIATPALAVDGVIEISQTCALQTGCFSGDSAAFPVTINAGGSYRLTSDLVVPGGVSNTDAVNVVGSNVTLDLNGFTIIGATETNSTGIEIMGNNVEVRNGTVRAANDCVVVGGDFFETFTGIRLIDLRSVDNRNDGIQGFMAKMRIESCEILGNVTGITIIGNASTVIINSIVSDNTNGVILGGASPTTLRANVFTSNLANDFSPGANTVVELGANQCGSNTTCP